MSQTKAELQAEIRRLKYRIRALEHAIRYKPLSGDPVALLIESLPLILWTVDTDLRFTSVDGAAADFADAPAGSMVGLTMQDFFGTSDNSFLPISAALRALNGETLQYSHEWLEKYLLVNVTPLRDPGNHIVGVSGVALDLTEQREAEARLRDVENRYRGLLNAIDEVVFWYEFDGTIIFANAAAERLFSSATAEGLRGKNVSDVLLPESAALLRSNTHVLLGGAHPVPIEIGVLTDAGTQISLQLLNQLVLSHGQPFCIQATGRDMTERKALEQQVRAGQKLHAVGMLSGAIASDLTDLMTCLAGKAEMLRDRTPAIAEDLEPILSDVSHAAGLVRHLGTLGLSSKAAVVPLDLHGIIAEVLSIIQRTGDKKVRVVASLRASHQHVLGDLGQLQQALLNLCSNAREAMPKGGDLRVYTRNAGSNIVISVQDTGSGMSERVRKRLFEPFFTTKASGRGLGLAVVSGVARNHGGAVHVESQVGRGTIFHLTLPVCDVKGSPLRLREVVGGRGRVLVIDDEIEVCQVVGKALRTLGYDVEIARRTDGAKYYELNHPHIDVVFFDGGASPSAGHRYLKRLRDINPVARIIMLGARPARPDTDSGVEDPLLEVLSKPYRYQDLAAALTRLVRREAAHNA
ncbi:MAG TPA: ATP-binding protein [Bryobacteraceae bacterium]|nr:ATP-binding protein [Bryobacteraceae bacterium]